MWVDILNIIALVGAGVFIIFWGFVLVGANVPYSTAKQRGTKKNKKIDKLATRLENKYEIRKDKVSSYVYDTELNYIVVRDNLYSRVDLYLFRLEKIVEDTCEILSGLDAREELFMWYIEGKANSINYTAEQQKRNSFYLPVSNYKDREYKILVAKWFDLVKGPVFK
jgi:hypothetical protein